MSSDVITVAVETQQRYGLLQSVLLLVAAVCGVNR
jgi:hypothetical protein